MGGNGTKSKKGGGGGGASKATLTERAKNGDLSVKELTSMDSGSRAVMYNNMPVGTRVTAANGTTYTKESNGNWRPSGSDVVLGRSAKRTSVSSLSASKKTNKATRIQYPRSKR